MPNSLNRAKETTATTGTGTVNLGGAVSGFQTWAAAGGVSGSEYTYLITDGSAWEVGVGTWTDAAPDTLSRGLIESSTGALLNLTGSAVVAQIAAAHDLRFRGCRVKKNADQTAANYTTSTAIAWDTEEFDTDAFHDNVTNNVRITIPAGRGINHVRLDAAVRIDAFTADAWANLFIRKNGDVNLAYGSVIVESGNAGGRIYVSSGPVPVVDGDYFEALLNVETDTSVTLPSHVGTYFALEVIG